MAKAQEGWFERRARPWRKRTPAQRTATTRESWPRPSQTSQWPRLPSTGSTRTTAPTPAINPRSGTHGRRIEIEFVRKAGKDSARDQPSGALTPAMENANMAEVTQKLPQRTKTVEDHDPRGAAEA